MKQRKWLFVAVAITMSLGLYATISTIVTALMDVGFSNVMVVLVSACGWLVLIGSIIHIAKNNEPKNKNGDRNEEG